MSRCFPYPPPGYVRNPVAVAVAEAESTAKLQKEREKANKKKEKKNDKKAVQQSEASKHSKHSHKKRKHEVASTAGLEPKRTYNESVEQLEKSGLSEEHGAPCFMKTIHDSPESSQDSSKRRKVLPSPNQAKNGNIVRIKIKSNQDLQAAVLEKGQPLVQPDLFLPGEHNSIQKHNKVNVRSTSALRRISGDSQAVQDRVSAETPAKIMHGGAPQPAVKARQLADTQLSVKAPVGRSDLPPKFLGSVNPSPAKMTRNEHPSPKILQKVGPQLPSQEIRRKGPEFSTKLPGSPVCPAEASQLPLVQRRKDLCVPMPLEPSAPAPKEEPCSSGREAEAVPGQEVKLSRSDRKKIRKAEKKERKFRDLFVAWSPVEMVGSDPGELDWLLGGTRNSDASMTKCSANDSFVPIRSMEQQTPLQPRAVLLSDLNVYQLPYVIPF